MHKKVILLAASTALCGLGANGAYAADNVIPAAALNGNGASSIANVLVQELNCYGGTNSPLGLNDGTTSTIAPHAYHPAKTSAGNPDYDCATMSVQNNVTGQYVSTGSGPGKTSWKSLNTSGITTNPFTFGSHIQFAFSDSPIAQGDLDTYNSSAAPTAGAGIQIPMYVLPVAIAYSPSYGKLKTATGITSLAFHLKYPRADGTGGLRLTKDTYCKIFLGTITNWNSTDISDDNGKQSLMDPQDSPARWASEGVPIKLVGRFENSGTTNIFTRALAAQCGGAFGTAGNDQLPTTVKTYDHYDKGTGGVLGTKDYDKATGAFIGSTPETPGKFALADGSDGVAKAVDRAPADPTGIGQVTLNGHLAYVGADWVRPSTLSGSGLHSADLEVALTGKKFLAPTATNATAAFKGVLPPQSAKNGKYNPTSPDAGSLPGSRTSPLAWVFPASAVGNTLANPGAGYPITGTTNVLLYTCYADPAVRKAIANFALFHLGKVNTPDNTADGAPAKVPAKLASNTAKDGAGLPTGILPRNGIAPLPSTFVNGIVETFFTKGKGDVGNLNLWIQDKLQKKTADVLSANPNCGALTGA